MVKPLTELASIYDHRLLSLLEKRNQSDAKTPVRHSLIMRQYFETMTELNSIYAAEIADKPKFPAPNGNLDCETAVIGGAMAVIFVKDGPMIFTISAANCQLMKRSLFGMQV
jgi:hypothetical protein